MKTGNGRFPGLMDDLRAAEKDVAEKCTFFAIFSPIQIRVQFLEKYLNLRSFCITIGVSNISNLSSLK